MVIKSSYIIIAIVLVIAATGGGYFYYRSTKIKNSPSENPSGLKVSPQTTKNQSIESCRDFDSKYGASAGELVQYINSEPDAAIVLKDYKNILINITGILPTNNQAIILELDGLGKITNYICNPLTIQSFIIKDKNTDIEFKIPESDFAQIIRYRETLETEQAISYLQNVTSNPPEAKNTLLLRIQAL